jgi:hypothetical protein
MVTLDGTLNPKGNSDASYAVNGDDPQPFPQVRYTFPLDVTSTGS